MTEARRQEIREKIAAGEARQQARGTENGNGALLDRAGEQAIETKDKVTAFVREHPIASVAGAIAVGVLISGMFRGSPTRRVGSAAASKAAGLATLGAELAVAYAQRARDAASEAGRAGAERFDDLSDTVGDRARHLRREARHLAAEAGDSARIARRGIGKSLRRRMRDRAE